MNDFTPKSRVVLAEMNKLLIEQCKVEFNQPSCWLYFVPNLLVF